jgi:hypothetical protein
MPFRGGYSSTTRQTILPLLEQPYRTSIGKLIKDIVRILTKEQKYDRSNSSFT